MGPTSTQLSVLAALVLLAPARAQLSFTLTPVGPALRPEVAPVDITEPALLHGNTTNPGGSPASSIPFEWQSGNFTYLQLPAGHAGIALAGNDAGVVVGYSRNVSLVIDAACKWVNGAYTPLAQPPGTIASFAADVHPDGRAVGASLSPTLRPCSWSPTGALTVLPLPSGSSFAEATRIRQDGVIVGTAVFGSARHVCTWSGASVTDLTPTTTDYLLRPRLLDSGDALASRLELSGGTTPVLVSGGAVVSLPTLAGGRGSCNDGNSRGWIVGTCTDAAQQPRAVLYVDGALFDLNALVTGAAGWVLQEATGVTDEGRICGYGLLSGVRQGFVLTPQCSVASYCTAGTSANGCVATMSATGAPSASAASGFVVQASGVDGQRTGLVFYGNSGAVAAPWGSGSSTLCVRAPTQRTAAQSSGGTAGACDGLLALDFNAYIAAHPAAIGAPLYGGAQLFLQTWYRDPPAPKSTSLSDALHVVVCP